MVSDRKEVTELYSENNLKIYTTQIKIYEKGQDKENRQTDKYSVMV